MTLSAGTRLGPYEVLSAIGAGGMGEVYRARDTSLKRNVALKILPESFSADPERLARFQRDAEVLASLNHPNIAAIYGLEDDEWVKALVMELVDGEDLAERLERGPVPPDEALEIARQIADALDAAHASGIIHRDLKPANIKLRPDGAVKVLDFGLAKALDRAAEGDPAQSPTVTAVGTQAGVILGTAGYMSPEQARGRVVDKRTDIWAFGCVLYQMLTGRVAFAGETVSDTVARVLEREPDWNQLPPATPASIRRLMRRCLQKDPRRRLRDFGDALLELQEATNGPGEQLGAGLPRQRAAVWIAVGLLIALSAGLAGWFLKPSGARVSRLSHVLAAGESFGDASKPLIAMAPDGGSIVYATDNHLSLRLISEGEPKPIRGTEGSPAAPFFSPDGQTLGYWDVAASELRKIPVTGGTPVSLASAGSVYGASWSDDRILYAQPDGIWRVSADGGTPEHLVPIKADELAYGPRMVGDGKVVLFSLVSRGSITGQSTAWDSAQVVLQSLETGERRALVRGSDARVLATGHLLYALDRNVFAVPVDLATQQVTAGPVPVVEGVQRMVRGSGGQGGGANYDVSQQGTLVYIPGFLLFSEVPRQLLVVDKEGKAQPLIDDRRAYWRPRISRDGTRVAVEVLQEDARSTQIWIADLKRRTANPLAVEGGDNGYPVWTPDGQWVIYRSNIAGRRGTYRRAADGSGSPQPVAAVDGTPTDVSHDGVLAFNTISSQDIGTLRLKDLSTSDFVATPAREHMARFSPDGKLLAYTSNESGRDEVYVRPFPATEGVGRLVSVGGGAGPVWAPDGSRLYYRGASGELMEVPVTLTPRFTHGRPHPLFRYAGIYRMSGTAAAYDIHPDGKRFIMVSEPEDSLTNRPHQQVNVVLNWFEDLKRLVPAK